MQAGPSPRDLAGGAPGLVDGVCASTSHNNGLWLGFEGTDMTATVDLGRTVDVNRIRARFLHLPDPWIFRPEKVVFSASEDGRSFQEIATIQAKTAPKEPGPTIENFEAEGGGLPARYLRVHADGYEQNPDWHRHSGENCWIFCDEVLVNPTD